MDAVGAQGLAPLHCCIQKLVAIGERGQRPDSIVGVRENRPFAYLFQLIRQVAGLCLVQPALPLLSFVLAFSTCEVQMALFSAILLCHSEL